MSLFARFLHSAPGVTARRSYSYFSSKSGGGGKYFNASKPVVTSSPKDAKSEGNNANTTPGSPQSSQTVLEPTISGEEISAAPVHVETFVPTHPTLTEHEYKLHRFFSLHRPLLTASQPTSHIFSPPSSSAVHPYNILATPSTHAPPPPAHVSYDDPPEATPEADADTARQLARAMVMHRVAGSIEWDATLRRLGLDIDTPRQEETKMLENEFQVMLDSTKRKRRKKMKKHK
jgi:hypothetical protein